MQKSTKAAALTPLSWVFLITSKYNGCKLNLRKGSFPSFQMKLYTLRRITNLTKRMDHSFGLTRNRFFLFFYFLPGELLRSPLHKVRESKQSQILHSLAIDGWLAIQWRNSAIQVLASCTAGCWRWPLSPACLLHLFSCWVLHLPSAMLAKTDC